MDKKILRDEYERQAEILISGDLVDADLLPPRRLIPPAARLRPPRRPGLLPGNTEWWMIGLWTIPYNECGPSPPAAVSR